MEDGKKAQSTIILLLKTLYPSILSSSIECVQLPFSLLEIELLPVFCIEIFITFFKKNT